MLDLVSLNLTENAKSTQISPISMKLPAEGFIISAVC